MGLGVRTASSAGGTKGARAPGMLGPLSLRDLCGPRIVDGCAGHIYPHRAGTRPSVQQAVECAIAIQRTMAERNAAVPPSRQMRFRIGVNLGDVMYDGTRAYGDGLNVAARVQALADPGGICVTALVREEVSARTSLAFEALGAQRLKNIPRPVRVFRVRLGDQGESGTPPPVGPHGAPRAWRRAVLLGLLAVGLVGILGLGVRLALYRGLSVDRPRLSIAVLPFSNLSGDPDQDYFSDALTEDLTTDLSRIEGAFVIARNTMPDLPRQGGGREAARPGAGRPLPAGRQCALC
jgi:adenylate cyclase